MAPMPNNEMALQHTPKSTFALAFASVLSVFLCSCAPSVRLKQPDIHLPSSFEAAHPSADVPAVSLDRWWDEFHDPQLNALISEAFERSTTARLAYARIAEARAVRAQNRASTGPTGNLTGSATEQGTRALWGASATQNGYHLGQLGFSPSWEVDLFGRLANIRRRADLASASSTLDFYATQLALAADVAANLFQARYLATQLADAQDSLRIARELAKASALGQAHGITAAQDVARVDADAASSEAEVTRLQSNLQVSKRSLLILIGNPAALTDSLAIEAALNPPPAVPVVAPGALLTRRPDVLSAEVALQSAVTKIKIDRLSLFPKFTIQAGVGLSATGNSPATGILAGSTGFWSIVAGVALPILDRPALMANLRISEAQGQEAVIVYEHAVQAAYGEAENTMTNVAADQRRIEALGRATRNAKIAFDAARKGYAAGLTDLTTLLQAERVWLQDRSSLNTVRVGLLNDTVSAIKALGGGWNPEPIGQLTQPSTPNPGHF